MGGSPEACALRSRLSETGCRGSGGRFNESGLRTVVVAIMTSQMKWGSAPGNVPLSRRATGLPRESVANVSQLYTIDRSLLRERVRALPREALDRIDDGLRMVLDL